MSGSRNEVGFAVREFDEGLWETQLASEWRSLTLDTGGSFFQTPEWVGTWWRHLANRPRSLLATWEDDTGALAAVAFMSRVSEQLHPRIRIPISVWVNSGSGVGAGDHLGFPVRTSREENVRRWLRDFSGPLRLSNLAGNQVGLALGMRTAGVTQVFRRRLDHGEPAIASASARKHLRYSQRRLEKMGLTFEILLGKEIGPRIIDSLVDLHGERFSDLGRPSAFGEERKGHLLALVDCSQAQVRPIAVVARDAEEIVGVDLSFQFGNTLSNYQKGWTPRYKKYSLGFVMVGIVMNWAVAKGMSEFDCLRGNEEWKARIGATEDKERSFFRPRGFSGALLGGKVMARKHLR